MTKSKKIKLKRTPPKPKTARKKTSNNSIVKEDWRLQREAEAL